jgi:hypothetical protein
MKKTGSRVFRFCADKPNGTDLSVESPVFSVIPAKAGIQILNSLRPMAAAFWNWIPAFAGMTRHIA